eukprot:278099_1
MSINYEKISDEWLEYISKLELDERKQKFQQYLEASGVYDLDSSTTFYKSELNNFLTEGITTLLHNKAQDAKKSGKGLAHYRHTSFMLSKPDAMNIVHQYIHAKMLAHPLMVEQGTTAMPDKFKWDFLFNVPEYVFHKPLLSESDIPQLPEPRKIPKEDELNYSPDHFPDDNAEYSPDPFDVDDQQQVIENLKDKFVTNPIQEQQEDEEEEADEEYSPDPYDIDDTTEQYAKVHLTTESTVQDATVDPDEPITFTGFQHEDGDETHKRETTVITGGGGGDMLHTKAAGLKSLQREPSNYLDEWIEKDAKPGVDGEDKLIMLNSNEDKATEAVPPNHQRPGSTIQGGYWKNVFQDQVMEKLNDATDHRDQMVRAINDENAQQKDMFDSMLSVQKIVQNIANDLRLNDDKDRQREREREREREKERQKEREYNDDKDSLERKIKELERQIEDLQSEIGTKDKLIQKQSLHIKELEVNQDVKSNMDLMKKELLQQIQLQLEDTQQRKRTAPPAFDNEKVNEIIGKSEDIMLKLGSVHKLQQQMKQQYALLNEQMDGVNANYENYHHQTTKKMAEYHSQLKQNIANIELPSNNRNNNNNNGVVVHEMAKLTTLTSQLTQDMGAASMLSVMRNEYDNMRKEKEEMRTEIERYRRENQSLLLKKLELEEEAINARESKRRTIKNLVDELNDMRSQIHRLSKTQ